MKKIFASLLHLYFFRSSFRITKLRKIYPGLCIQSAFGIHHSPSKKINMIKKLLLLFILILSSCNRPDAPDCFKQAGKFSVKKISLSSPPTRITLESPLEVFVRPSPENYVSVEGPANLLEKISVSQNTNQISIRNRNRCNFVRGYKHNIRIYVNTPDVEFVRNLATGTITIEKGFSLDTLRLESEAGDILLYSDVAKFSSGSHGNGNIYVYGTIQKAHVYMYGTNFFYAEEGMISSYAYIEQNSVGDAIIRMQDGGLLNYVIRKSGNIYYYGNITTQGEIKSKGNIYKK